MPERRANHEWWTLFAMCFALFMIMLDNTVVNVALPSIQRTLHATPENLEWTVNAYVLSFAALILLGGKLGDRFGRKRMFLVGLAIFTLSSAACALSGSDSQLIAARVVQGVGAALMNPLSLSIIVSAFPRERIPTAIGIWAGVSALGLAIGPLVGGFLVEHVDWSAVFWINVPIGVVAAGVTMWAVHESRDPTTRSLDLPGVMLVTGGLFLLTWGLIKTNTHSWLSAYTLGFLVGALVLLVLFVLREAHTASPMLPLRFFRLRAFTVSGVVIGLVGFALFGVIYFLTLYFQNVKGYSALEAGARTLPNTLMVMLVGPFAGRLNARFGPRVLMTGGMLMAVVALAGLSRITVGASYNQIWPFFILLGAGLAMTMPSTTATAMGSVEPDKAGVASGVVNAMRQVGGALGVAVLGSVVATVASNRWHDAVSSLPQAARLSNDRITQAVIGGQGARLQPTVGPRLSHHAQVAFVDGVSRAMLVGAALMLVAAAVAFFGLAGVRFQARRGAAAPVEM